MGTTLTSQDRTRRLHALSKCARRPVANGEQLNLEAQVGTWGNDASCTSRTIPKVGRDSQHALLSERHLEHALVPSSNNLSEPYFECKRLALVLAT